MKKVAVAVVVVGAVSGLSYFAARRGYHKPVARKAKSGFAWARRIRVHLAATD